MSHNGRMSGFVFYEALACNKSSWDSAKSYALFTFKMVDSKQDSYPCLLNLGSLEH